MKKVSIFIICIFSLIAYSCSGSSVADVKPIPGKVYTIAALPFMEKVPYNALEDDVRVQFVKAFKDAGHSIDISPGEWQKIIYLDHGLQNLNEEEATSVAQILEVDILIYCLVPLSPTDIFSADAGVDKKFRPVFTIKAFDVNSGQVFLYRSHRLADYAAAGDSAVDFKDFARSVVRKIIEMGFIPER